MRNFTDRDIELSAYLPEILKNIREFREITAAESAVIRDLWEAADDCMNDMFILDATENGVARREKMLGITPFATDALNERKFRLLTKYAEKVPYTKNNLRKMLLSLCGDDGFSVAVDTSQKDVTVKIALTSKKQQKAIDELLERVLPYNMTFSTELMYNTWAQIKTLSWSQIKTLTWGELKGKETLA